MKITRAMAYLMAGTIAFGLCQSAFSQEAEAEAYLTRLRVESMDEPLAVDNDNPVFSWQMASGRTGARQTAYEIVVSDGEEVYWDSGRVESQSSVGIAYPEEAMPLKAETDYTWNLTVWDETGAVLTAGSTFGTGFMNEDLSAWHGAEWIGADELYLASETVPVFRLEFDMQIKEGGKSAGIVFGANDPRLLSTTKNNYLIHGENYITYQVKVDTLPAMLEVYRKGYAPGEDGTEPVKTVEIPEEMINEENRYDSHSFEIVISGNQMEYMTIDGTTLITGEGGGRSMAWGATQDPTKLILNPLGQTMDVPIFPRLCEVGFVTDDSTEAVFTDYLIRNYDPKRAVVFGENVGATYAIFDGIGGLKAEGNQITADAGTFAYADPSYGSVPMLRKDFTAEKPVASAKAYVTARGLYEMTINGQKVGEDYLSPGDTDFRQHILYYAYDVTDLIAEGDNAVGAVLASGWYMDQVYYTTEEYNWYDDKPSLLALIAVTYEDGTVDYIPTDSTWQYYGQGPVRYAGNFNGEIYDATREAAVEGFDEPGYDAGAWRPAAAVESTIRGITPAYIAALVPGIRVVKVLDAEYVGAETRGDDNDTVYIYDMGENMVGVPQITFPEGEAGQEITVRYGEILYPNLEEDNPYYYGDLGGLILTENLRGALATDRYTMKGESGESFCPVFTFHGYRYVEISGISEPIPAENIKGVVLSSIKQASYYESSNELTTKLFDNIIRSTSGNHLSIPTDCPQRDERLGWAGDLNAYIRTDTYMADQTAFFNNYTLMQRDSQGADGTYHLFAPSYNDIGSAFALGYMWNASGAIVPYENYLQYGDISILEANYPNMKLHVDGMCQMKAEGCEYLTSNTGFSGDHLAVVDTDVSLLGNAMFYHVVRYLQGAAEALGKKEDAAAFASYAEGLKNEWNAVYVNADHKTQMADGTLQDTQGSYALPLSYGLFNEENEPYARENLLSACEATGYTMTTGFMTTGSLLPALTEAGESETAYRLFEQTAYPSWLYPVVNGATSVWERWNSYTIENGFGGNNGMNSFNHYSLGAVGSWMMEYQAGIGRGETAGFQSFVLQPLPGGHFTYVKAAYDSQYGRIESGWTAEDGKLATYDAIVPANTTAILYLPATEEEAQSLMDIAGASYEGMEEHNGMMTAVFELESGSYHFDVK